MLPELWTDWCAATGVPMSHVDEPTLARFSQQVTHSLPYLSLGEETLAIFLDRCRIIFANSTNIDGIDLIANHHRLCPVIGPVRFENTLAEEVDLVTINPNP